LGRALNPQDPPKPQDPNTPQEGGFVLLAFAALGLLVALVFGNTGGAPQGESASPPWRRLDPLVERRGVTKESVPVSTRVGELPPLARPRVPEAPLVAGSAPAPLERVWSGLNYPRALAGSPAGELYLMDKSGLIRVFDTAGRERLQARTPAIENGTPSAMTWHPAGLLLVADSHYGQVLVYGPELVLRDRWGQHGRAPGSFMLLTGIACDQDGLIYVSDQGDDIARVQVFDLGGRLQRVIGQFGSRVGELNRPMGLAVFGKELAVADSLNHRVQVFDLEGKPLRRFGRLGEGPGDLKYPYDVSYDPAGRLFVAEQGNHRLQTEDGGWSFGKPGRKLGDLNSPWCVLALGERIFVTDGGNDRVYELAALPKDE
jgi:DNA-binding beta-propeller fold protein YncE